MAVFRNQDGVPEVRRAETRRTERHCRMKNECHAVGVLPGGNPFLFFFRLFSCFLSSAVLFLQKKFCVTTWRCARSAGHGALTGTRTKASSEKKKERKDKQWDCRSCPGSASVRTYLRSFLWICIAAALCACASVSAGDFRESRFDAIIREVAEAYDVDPLLIKAMVWHESRFNPLAEGRAGEIGLMQIKMIVVRDWAKAKGVKVPPREEIFDPYVNLEIGTWYFARAFTKWQKSTHALLLALGEYNAGPGRVRCWISRFNGNKELAISRSASAGYVRSIRDKYLEYTIEHAGVIASASDRGQWQTALSR